MLGIFLGLIAALNYIFAACFNNSAYWAGMSTSYLILIVLGIILFPKTIMRILQMILGAAPIAVICALIFHLGNMEPLLYSIAVGVGAAISAAIVKAIRPRAREVDI